MVLAELLNDRNKPFTINLSALLCPEEQDRRPSDDQPKTRIYMTSALWPGQGQLFLTSIAELTELYAKGKASGELVLSAAAQKRRDNLAKAQAEKEASTT